MFLLMQEVCIQVLPKKAFLSKCLNYLVLVNPSGLPKDLSFCGRLGSLASKDLDRHGPRGPSKPLERETGFEPATFSLEG